MNPLPQGDAKPALAAVQAPITNQNLNFPLLPSVIAPIHRPPLPVNIQVNPHILFQQANAPMIVPYTPFLAGAPPIAPVIVPPMAMTSSVALLDPQSQAIRAQAALFLQQQQMQQAAQYQAIKNAPMPVDAQYMAPSLVKPTPIPPLVATPFAKKPALPPFPPALFLAMTNTRDDEQSRRALEEQMKESTLKMENDALQFLGGTTREAKNGVYFDASILHDPDDAIVQGRRSRGGIVEPFPERVHRMLTDAEREGNEDVLSFFPHGRGFAIHKQDEFVEKILPKYFRHSRMASFQRQLNLYGFNRISSGPDEGGYYHELFLRGRPKLTCHMRRVGVSYPTVMLPSGVKIPRADGRRARKSFFGTDPDFYAMRPISLDPDKAVGEVKQNENGNGEKPKEEGTNMQSVASDTALKTGDTSLGPKPVENDAQPSIGRLETALEVAQATDTTAKPVAHESAVSSLSKPLGGQDIVSETQSSEVFEVKSETSSQSDNNYAAALPISPGAANDPMKLLALGD